MTPTPRVAVILVNHQDYARPYLAACYTSLVNQTYPADRFTLFIVNNGLPEAETRLTEQLAPSARILLNAENRGWGGGNNTAIAVALREGFDDVVLVNIDTVADPGWLEALVERAERDPDVHIVQSLILLDGTTRVNSAGNRTQFLGYGYCTGYGQDASAGHNGLAMDYASGASMLVKRAVFERIGLFREEFFLYYDDMEFCWRARLAGFNVGRAERSVCHHAYSFQGRMERLYYFQRNRLLTLLTLERAGTLLLIAPCLLISELLVDLYLIGQGRGGVVWALARYFARGRTWRQIAARRREVRAIRRRRDADIVKGFAARIVFAEMDSAAMRYVFNPLLWMYWTLVKPWIRW